MPASLDSRRLNVPGVLARRVQLGGATMGTNWRVTAWVPGDFDELRFQEAATRLFADLTAQLSNWEPGSVVSRFNAAPAGTRFSFSADAAAVIRAALSLAHCSDGAFDPALGERCADLRFSAIGAARLDEELLDDVAGWRELETPDVEGRLRQPGGVQLDLSGIAKGLAVDRLSELLVKSGAPAFLAEIGGEFRARGIKPDHQPWWVSLGESGNAVIALVDAAVATSGCGQRLRRTVGGAAANHIVARHRGASRATAVTVVHESCMWADGWATALYASGVDDGLALASEHGIAALYQLENDTWRATRALQAWLSENVDESPAAGAFSAPAPGPSNAIEA